MRSLFLRIFLSFWAAMLLVLSATASVAWYRFNQVQSVSIDIKALGNEASARLLVGGLPALQDWIDEAEHRYRDRRIFIVDQSGDDLRKRTLPTTYRNYIQRLRDAGFLLTTLTCHQAVENNGVFVALRRIEHGLAAGVLNLRDAAREAL